MRAIIMAGGMGSRLRPLTKNLPKPMVPIIDKPILEHIINHLKSYKITDISITLGYRPFDIISYFGSGEDWGVNIKYFVEKQPLGTAGSVKNAIDFEGNFLVISGDALTTIDLDEMKLIHNLEKGKVTMAVKGLHNPKGYGIVEATDNGKVRSFKEKPEYDIDFALVNMGIYMMHTDILEYITEGFCDFSKDVFPKVLADINLYPTEAYWSDIGTLESYYTANRDVCINPAQFNIRL